MSTDDRFAFVAEPCRECLIERLEFVSAIGSGPGRGQLVH